MGFLGKSISARGGACGEKNQLKLRANTLYSLSGACGKKSANLG
jgi:hypothetical protein